MNMCEQQLFKRALIVALLVAGSVALAGCGAARHSGGTPVAFVQGSPISRAALAHWTAIESAGTRGASAGAGAKEKALEFLITARWIEGEAAARGIHASPTEAQATYERLTHGPAGVAFVSQLRRAGLDTADELLQLRLEQLAAGLRAKTGTGRRLAAFVEAYRSRWRARTSCRPGYVVPECREHAAAASSKR